MRSTHDSPGAAAGRLRPAPSKLAALLLSGLAALALAAGCGDDTRAISSSTPGARSASPATRADDGLGPPKVSRGVCVRVTVDKKSLPSLARVTVERFVVAVDQGDREAMRALFDPLGADEVLAHLRPVTRLGLLELEDRY